MEDAEKASFVDFIDVNEDVLTLKEHKGDLLFPRFSGIYCFAKMHLRSDDIWIYSYPKSGTHWIYEVIHMLVNNTTNYCTHHAFLANISLEDIEGMKSPRILSTHGPYTWIPKDILENKHRRIITIYRNPKDTAVSLYHYVKKCSAENYSGSWSGFLDLFMQGKVPYGSWFEHLRNWENSRKANLSMLFVKYEDLKKNFQTELTRIADYLGLAYNKELFEAIEDRCSFRKMSKSQETILSFSYAAKDGKCPIFGNEMEDTEKASFVDVIDINGDILTLKKYKHHLFSPRVTVDNCFAKIHTRADDIFIYSYPKSGTHWLYEVTHMLVNNTTNYCTKHGFLANTSLEDIEQMASPRILSTHGPYTWIPKEVLENKHRRIITIYRNPKDTAVSMYHFVKKFSAENYNGSWNGFLDLFMQGKVPYGSWFEHLRNWENIRKAYPDILFVKYEELKKNFRTELIRIADYLGVEYSKEFFDAIEENCSFQKMSKSQVTNLSFSNATKDGRCPIFRKGEVGNCKNYFTVAQNEAFDAVYEAEMKNSNITFRFI